MSDDDQIAQLCDAAAGCGSDFGGLNPAYWEPLSFPAREKALRRLRALAGSFRDADGQVHEFRTAKEAATYAGMGLSTFYAMQQRWQEQPGLSALSLSPRRPANRTEEAVREQAIAVLRSHLEDNPEIGTQDLVRALNEAGLLTSKTTAMRLIREARRFAGVSGAFGRHLAIDSAGLDLVSSPFAETRVRLHALIDAETSLVLASGILPERVGPAAYRIMAQRALENIDALDLAGVRSDGSSMLEVRMPPDDRAGNALLHKRLHLRPSPLSLAERQVGGIVVRTLGNSIAGVALGVGQRLDSRSYRNGRSARFESVSPIFSQLVDDFIREHNKQVLELLPRDGDEASLIATREAIESNLANLVQTVEKEEARAAASSR